MRIVLLGRKPVACEALRFLVSEGIEVAAVVPGDVGERDSYSEDLSTVADNLGVPIASNDELYAELNNISSHRRLQLHSIELVLSILHQRRILRPLIELPSKGCVNFHPAPLPRYRGWGTYSMAILEGESRWGASAHLVDDDFDTGPILETREFDFDAANETALELQVRTQPVLLQLVKCIVSQAKHCARLIGRAQGEGRTFRRQEVLAQRFIKPIDTSETADRKVRAFWYPPNPPAEIEVAGAWYPIIPRSALDQIRTGVSREASSGLFPQSAID